MRHFLTLALLLGLATPAAAQEAPPATVSGAITSDGKQAPLPAGTWTVLARDEADDITATVLGRLNGKALDALAVVRTNRRKTKEVMGTSSECSRSDSYFAVIRYDTPVDGYCTYANAVLPEPLGGGAAWEAAALRLAADGVALPSELMMVGARARTRENLLDLRYYFTAPDPVEPRGGIQLAAWDEAPLNPARAADSPALQQRVSQLRRWADALREPAELGVRGRMPTAMGGLPLPWNAQEVDARHMAQKRQPLDALRSAGAIDEAEYARQLAVVEEEAGHPPEQSWSLWTRSLYKVVTYRVASTIDTLAVSWFITQSVGQTIGFASINAVTKPFLAYFNEIAWAGSGVGRAKASLASLDFPEIGRDR